MVTDEDNATIERMIEEGKSALAIRAAVPDVSRTNVYLKISKFKKHGTVGRVQTKTLGRPRVMNEGIDKFLQGLLAAKPDMELEEMRRHMQDQLHLNVSMSTISRAISRAGIASGRPNRSRNSSRRKNKGPTASEPADIAQVDAVSANDQNPTNRDRSADDDIWDQMPSDTSLSQHHSRSQHQHQPQSQPQLQHSQHTQSNQSNQQHGLLQVSQQHVSQPEMHALDPSLAQAYPIHTAYHSVYPEVPGNSAHVGVGVNAVTQAGLDVYRSPYAPIQSDTHVSYP